MPSLTGWLRRPREPDADAQGDLAHLLDRPPIKLDTPEAQRLLGGRRVLVTGAGGSIGSELCRQIARFCPRRLVILDQSEFGLFTIRRELSARWLGLDLRAAIADVCDERRISDVLAQERPHVLFHAA
ncbi:MAG: polysaccharide biosynthesis protein, partial [Planctomycetota bacterium]